VKHLVVIHYPSERAENWRLLEDAARRKRIALVTWLPHLLQVYCSNEEELSYYDGEAVKPEVVLHRTVARFQGILTPALVRLAAAGTHIVNDPTAAFRARDKLLTTSVLRMARIPVVPTWAFFEPGEVPADRLGNGPLIVKPAHGVRGEGIVSFPSRRDFALTGDMSEHRQEVPRPNGYHFIREHYIAQPLVRGGGRDLRAFVVGGVCLGLMQREARFGEFRANLALGATGLRLPLAHPAASLAVAALAACELDFGGVDLIEDDDGVLRVLEVDAWAGFAGMSSVTGADIAGALLDLALGREGTSSSP
jgi:RimK family alpha-L-glutamate ligase